jgi:N-carbamoylputrescine amidase
MEGKMRFYGGSHIVGPTGHFLAGPAGDAEETILYAEIDLDEVVESRRKISFLKDRRPELYGAICESQPIDTRE